MAYYRLILWLGTPQAGRESGGGREPGEGETVYDCIVVGAGPTGSYVGGQLAQAGLSVCVLEEHSRIGEPIHCTGIVGDELFARFNFPRGSILKQLKHFKVFSPTGISFSFPERIRAQVVDRGRFDRDLAQRSQEQGCEYRLSTSVSDLALENHHVRVTTASNGSTQDLSARLVVLATGSMSNLPFKHGISKPEYFYRSVQVELDMADLPGAEMYLGQRVAPGSFAYLVSVNGIAARAGLISRRGVKDCLHNLLALPGVRERILKGPSRPNYRRIPMGLPRRTVAGRILAVGDAAGQLKTTTGGGILYGILCARLLCATILDCRTGQDFDLEALKRYDSLWKKEIGLELRAGLLLRSFFEQIGDRYLDSLLDLVRQPSMSQIMARTGDFDRHRAFIISLLQVPQVRRLAMEMARKNLARTGFIRVLRHYLADLVELGFASEPRSKGNGEL